MNDIVLVFLHKLRSLFTPHERSMLKALTENPENHNGIYRGKDLTNVYTVEQIYERVHDGSFEDLYLGDYFTVNITTDLYTRFTGSTFESGVTYYEMGGTVIARTWTETQDSEPQEGKVYCTKQVVNEDVDLMIAHFDYYTGRGASYQVDYPHIILIVINGFTTKAKMHTIADLTPYGNTDMNQITLPCYAQSLKTALNNHIRTFSGILASEINESTPSMVGGGTNGAVTKTANMMTELKLLSMPQFTNAPCTISSWRDIQYEDRLLKLFEFINPNVKNTDTKYTRNFIGSNSGAAMYAAITYVGTIGASQCNYARVIQPTMIFG